MEKISLILTLSFLFSLCQPSSPVLSEMKGIENIIQDEPKEALTRLYDIDNESLSGAHEKGLYALLLSMALDKNYIDLQSDSIIAPAVSYYSGHGDKRHRFLAFYYQGRVFENAKEYEKALDAYIKAEDLLSDTVSKEEEVRLYCAKARVFQHQFARKEGYLEMLKAKEVSSTIDNPEFYFRNCLDLASYYYLEGEKQKAEVELDSLGRWMKGKTLQRSSNFYKTKLRSYLVSESPSKDTVAALFNNYLQRCVSDKVAYDHLLAADAFLELNDLESAEQEFSLCKEKGNDYDDIMYYSTWSELYEKLGDANKALQGFYKHQAAVERISIEVFKNDVRFLEERHKTELDKQRDNYIKSWLALLVILMAGLAGYGTIRMVRYRAALKEAKEEYDFIAKLTQSEDGALKEVLSDRLYALEPYITKKRIMPVQAGRKGLEKMDEDRKAMLRSVGMIYALTYPKFVSELVRHKLSPEEVGMCSMYVSGYSSKELSDLLNRGDIYHLNSSIRAKIGDELSSARLHSWLKETFNYSQRG